MSEMKNEMGSTITSTFSEADSARDTLFMDIGFHTGAEFLRNLTPGHSDRPTEDQLKKLADARQKKAKKAKAPPGRGSGTKRKRDTENEVADEDDNSTSRLRTSNGRGHSNSLTNPGSARTPGRAPAPASTRTPGRRRSPSPTDHNESLAAMTERLRNQPDLAVQPANRLSQNRLPQSRPVRSGPSVNRATEMAARTLRFLTREERSEALRLAEEEDEKDRGANEEPRN